MKYFVIAGESSGDLHGANLIKQIKLQDEKAEFFGCGGTLMQAQNCQLVLHINQMDFMGFWEVVKHLKTIRQNFKTVSEAIKNFNPDVVILIDYPGFNLRLLKQLKGQYKTVYYISPQLWAWKASRVENIKKYVDLMLVILPFEKAFYQQYNYQVHYVGHPLIDAIQAFKQTKQQTESVEKHIVLMPGSRKQEIERMLPIYCQVAKNFEQQKFVIAGLHKFPDSYYQHYNLPTNVKLVKGQTYNLLKNAKAALVTSGTATLETALFNVPQVVCYKTSGLSYFIGKRLVKVKYVSLVNLIANKLVVQELLQQNSNKKTITDELEKLLNNHDYINEMKANYTQLCKILGGEGASQRAAIKIKEMII